MFSLERGMRYWLYSEPADMRKSFHTLSGLVVNGNEKCSDFGNNECSVFGIRSTAISASAVQ